jgi:hypothetical protein
MARPRIVHKALAEDCPRRTPKEHEVCFKIPSCHFVHLVDKKFVAFVDAYLFPKPNTGRIISGTMMVRILPFRA